MEFSCIVKLLWLIFQYASDAAIEYLQFFKHCIGNFVVNFTPVAKSLLESSQVTNYGEIKKNSIHMEVFRLMINRLL